jgi:hypothetical protein
MRYKFKEKTGPSYGENRTLTKYLIFPKIINGVFRWLETATWDESYHSGWDGKEVLNLGWIETRWRD